MLKTEIENGFTFGTFKLFLPKNICFLKHHNKALFRDLGDSAVISIL